MDEENKIERWEEITWRNHHSTGPLVGTLAVVNPQDLEAILTKIQFCVNALQ